MSECFLHGVVSKLNKNRPVQFASISKKQSIKLEKSLNGIVPALCNNKLFFVTSLERHKVSVHISDLFNSLNFLDYW